MANSDFKPGVYIFHGDDQAEIERQVSQLVARVGDADAVMGGVSHLDGRQLNFDELRSIVLTVPFFSTQRLVVLRNPLAGARGKDFQARFMALLDELPDTSTLVLPVEDYVDRKDWKALPEGKNPHWLRQWASKAGARAHFVTCRLPLPVAMPGWIQQQAVKMGGKFTAQAAAALAALVGNDTQIALQEMRKLLEYADYARPVEQEDVEQLSAVIPPANIFDMVDALAEGNASKAQRLMAILLETSREGVFGMVVRQFRLMIQVREMLDEKMNTEQISKDLGQHPFVAQKMARQAQRFSLARLVGIYHQLLEMDEAMKISQMTLETAMNLLVVEVAGR